MMEQCPHLDVEVKLTVHLCIAVVLYHTNKASKGVYSITKLACALLIKGVQGIITPDQIGGSWHPGKSQIEIYYIAKPNYISKLQ